MSAAKHAFANPEAVQDGADRLTAVSESLTSQWSRLAAMIETLHVGEPWGGDQPGQRFFKNYLEAAEKAPAKATLIGGGKLIERVCQLGPDVSSVVQGTADVDEIVGTWFSSGE